MRNAVSKAGIISRRRLLLFQLYCTHFVGR
ncbi:hypothetical protein [Escherichia coli]|nr:hypothetical protein [Escherichia coli]